MTITFLWPFDPQYRWISGYPWKGNGGAHLAEDFGTPNKANACASGYGVVVALRRDLALNDNDCKKGYGNYVEVDYGDGWRLLIAHLAEVFVNVGDKVTPGQIIGTTDNTGCSSGPHAHVKLAKNGSPVQPSKYFGDEAPPVPVEPPAQHEMLIDFVPGMKYTTTDIVTWGLNLRKTPAGEDIGDMPPKSVFDVYESAIVGNNVWYAIRVVLPGNKYPIYAWLAAFWRNQVFVRKLAT